jgi:protein tyrosine/serine phosphatase
MSRHIRFEGIENFRDFGGYTAGGGRLKGGLLYRSASHAKASDADLEQLAGLGLAVIVDLRRRNERDRDPSRRWPGFAAQVVESDIGQETADEWQAFIARSDLTPASFRAYMRDYYDAAPHEPRHIDLYTRYFRALAQTEGPVLVHCSAGKDRTGIACALTHHIAGVHPDDLMADYLLTNDPVRLANRAPLVIAAIRDLTGRTASEEAVYVAMRVEPEYLERGFAVMRERHGSIDGYLEQALGLDRELRERLRARLLA